jgi:holo-[acyl-carrier protein] synthase
MIKCIQTNMLTKTLFKGKIVHDFGVGTDIEKISRFRETESSELLFQRIFTKKELKYCYSKQNAAPHLAARFAAKESINKALSDLGKTMLDYRNIEISNKEGGVPVAILQCSKYSSLKIKISLSHCDDTASAFAVIMEMKDNDG